jgi:LysR family glycine cleavage system transcriptional activator|nr:LysR family transcriptional regulator [Brevundimonas diminuta]
MEIGMTARMPSLNALRAFEAAARSGSLVAAAAELNVTHGAVSKQVQSLERDLDTVLFERRNRGVHLTRKGEWLAERLGGAFAGLDQIMVGFRGLEATPAPLTISCEPTLSLRLLIPAMADLERETGLQVRILAAGGAIDFHNNNIDVAVRRNDFPLPSGVRATLLAPEMMGPVLSPSLSGREKRDVPRLHSRTRPHAWRNWSAGRDGGFDGPGIEYEHFYLALQAAEAGQGAALASVHMTRGEVQAGRLLAPEGFKPDGTAYVALRSEDSRDERIDRFIVWMQARMTVNLNENVTQEIA